MKRWFRFSFRSSEPDGQAGATTQVEEAVSAESQDNGASEGESPAAAVDASIERASGEQVEAASNGLSESPVATEANSQPETIAEALSKLFPGIRDFNAGKHDIEDATSDLTREWEPMLDMASARRHDEPPISAADLPPAADLLEKLFAPDEEATAQAVEEQSEPVAAAETEEVEVAEQSAAIDEPGIEVSQVESSETAEAIEEQEEVESAPEAAEQPIVAEREAPAEPEEAIDQDKEVVAEQDAFAEEGEMAEPEATDEVETIGEEAIIAEDDVSADSEFDLAASAEDEAAAAVNEAEPAPPPYRDWAFEEKLASHVEWVESQGLAGTKADFAGADLEGTELISVNLRFADFHDANLKSADLLLADLRDACLVRADLHDACLVGANLEGANLEGASLETALGLVPRQLAGANLRDASLPASFLEFAAVGGFERASQSAARYFSAMMAACVVCWLVLWKTKDVQLLTDSAVIPFLHSRAAAAALPTVESYMILPVLLFIVYLLFHFNLQSAWDSVLELPGVFPDGHTLGDKGHGVVLGLLRAHFHWIDQDSSSTRLVEKTLSVVLAYWAVPVTLLLFWERYLTRQELRGTLLHALLGVVATGVAVYATLKTGRPHERWVIERKWTQRVVTQLRAIRPATVAGCLAAALLVLSVGTIAGVPHARSRAPQYGSASIRRWAANLFWTIGVDPYADLTEASISTPPPNWTGADSQVASVAGPRLSDANFRYAQAYGVFLANAHLWRSDFDGAFLSDADFRGSDLGQSTFRNALMDGARLSHANLDRAVLDRADLRRADLREANLSHAWLIQSILVDAQLQHASFYGARLSLATMTRANLEGTDLRECYFDGAELEHADFKGAYLWSAKLPQADLKGAQLGGGILIDAYLRGADLRWAEFPATVLNGADLSGADLEGADLRGALGLSANQVCSAKSHAGAQMDDALQTQVRAQCPSPQERAAAEVTP